VAGQRRTDELERLRAGTEEQRELQARGKVPVLRIPEGESHALLFPERFPDDTLRRFPALHSLERQVRRGRCDASQRLRPSRVTRPEAGEHVPGELPRLAVVEELGGEVRAKLEALQLQEVIRRLSERSQPLVALLGCDQIPGDEGKFHAPQLASLKERDLAGRDGELPCTTKKGVSLLVAGIGIHAQGG